MDSLPMIPTADDVAELAGVSRWTVTRAFKKDAPISDKARSKVLAAAEKLGYLPDLMASSLASDRSNLVALVIDDFENPHKLVVLERLTRILRHAGYGTLLVNMLAGEDAASALVMASQRRVDAAVIIGTRFDEALLQAVKTGPRIRKLIVFARSSANPDTLSISCDDGHAMETIAGHLLQIGRKRPLYLAGPDTQSASLKRKESFLPYWAEKTGYLPQVIHTDRYAYASASAAVVELLSTTPKADWPDAIVCENDILAAGTMDALRYNLGLKVPQEISVTGFDDIPLAESPSYRLTTLRQPITKMAEALVEVLEGRITQDVFLQGKFLLRSSSVAEGDQALS